MSPLVKLTCHDAAASPGAVIGVVDVIDAGMATVASSVVRSAEPVTVWVPTSGRYFADGRLADGGRLTTTFTATTDAEPATATLVRRPVTVHEPDTADMTRALQKVGGTGWLLSWRQRAGQWYAEPAQSATPLSDESVLIATVGSPRPYAPLAVQVGGVPGAPRITVVPAGTPLLLVPAGTEREPSVATTLQPGLDATLLRFLHRGDSAAADVAASAALVLHPEPGRAGNGLLDLAIGYHLLRTQDERAADWVAGMLRIQPDSADAAVLDAWLQLERTSGDGPHIRDAFARAASYGLPVVAEGLRLLVDGLALINDRREPAEPHRLLRRYLIECLPGPITTFTGVDPMSPGTRPGTPAAPSPLALQLSGIAGAMRERSEAEQIMNELYDPHVELIFRHAYVRVGNRQLAEDLTCDSFLRALRRWSTSGEAADDLRSRLIAVTRSLIADHFKSRQYRVEIRAEPELHRDGVLLQILQQLRPEQQECLVLRFLHGLSVESTGLALGKTVAAVVTLQHRALLSLVRRLPDGFLTEGGRAGRRLFPHRAAVHLARLIDGDDIPAGDLGELVALSRRLAAVPLDADVDAEFRAGLRAMLVATIERDGAGAVEATEAAAPASRSPYLIRNGRRIRARGAIVIGISAGAMAVSGISAASYSASPGDALYVVKRQTERAQLAMAGSDVTRGRLSLDFARTRLAEAAVLDSDDDLAGVLDDMDQDTLQGVRLLTQSAAARRDPAPLGTVEAFAEDQRSVLAGMRDENDGRARARIVASLALLDQAGARVEALRTALTCAQPAFGAPDRFGPVPARKRC